MLTLYHHPLSANSRRVWILLLEKNLPFELVALKLDGDQLQPKFLELNPFHQVPVLVDDGFRVVESLAILDYLEAKYPTPPMLPIAPQAVGVVRMVQLLTLTALRPALIPLTYQMLGTKTYEPQALETARQEVETVFKFFEQLLGKQRYFGGEALTLADITASTSVLTCHHLDISLQPFAKLQAWCERLLQRSAWQTTEPSAETIAAFKQARS
ncbi:glutathione S-transferase domain-containing protein [Leptolyngbya sp. NIES-3755]|nr:glutathione S-transferase domain-containing protein [Leptolyngbya sp. NIES-3755]